MYLRSSECGARVLVGSRHEAPIEDGWDGRKELDSVRCCGHEDASSICAIALLFDACCSFCVVPLPSRRGRLLKTGDSTKALGASQGRMRASALAMRLALGTRARGMGGEDAAVFTKPWRMACDDGGVVAKKLELSMSDAAGLVQAARRTHLRTFGSAAASSQHSQAQTQPHTQSSDFLNCA